MHTEIWTRFLVAWYFNWASPWKYLSKRFWRNLPCYSIVNLHCTASTKHGKISLINMQVGEDYSWFKAGNVSPGSTFHIVHLHNRYMTKERIDFNLTYKWIEHHLKKIIAFRTWSAYSLANFNKTFFGHQNTKVKTLNGPDSYGIIDQYDYK